MDLQRIHKVLDDVGKLPGMRFYVGVEKSAQRAPIVVIALAQNEWLRFLSELPTTDIVQLSRAPQGTAENVLFGDYGETPDSGGDHQDIPNQTVLLRCLIESLFLVLQDTSHTSQGEMVHAKEGT